MGMWKKNSFLCFLVVFMALFSVQSVVAFDPDWKEKQTKMFNQIKLNPGEVIDKSNWQKVKDVLPESIVNWIKKGEYAIKIGELKYDFSPDEAWDKSHAANRGKYGLGKKKEVIDKSTGKFPMNIYGRPFPDIDWKNDPDAGIKIMHNKKIDEGRSATQNATSATDWLRPNSKKPDRTIISYIYQYYFQSRPDGEQENPNKLRSFELSELKAPYDLAGFNVLSYSYLDGSDDRQYMYVPAIRRVKKQSGANRSDPYFGSDFVMDDMGGWGGQNVTMKWRVLGEKIVLMPLEAVVADHPDQYVKQPNGAWKSMHLPVPKFAYNDKNAPAGLVSWCPTSTVWVPREFYLIEATPLDPYYNYGKQVYWIDKATLAVPFKIVNDKSEKYWKTATLIYTCEQWGDDNKRTYSNGKVLHEVDDRSRHCSISNSQDFVFMNKNVDPKKITPESIATLSK